MTGKPALLISAFSIAVLSAGCETITTEKSNYNMSDGKTESILDSRIRKLEEETVKYPLKADLHYQIASLHAKKGDCLESAKALERAIAISPDEAKYHFHLGRLFLNMSDLTRAEEQFRKALGLSQEGRYTGPHAALAWTLSLKKQHDAAIEEFQKCVQIEPENPIYYFFLGAEHDIKRDHEKAIYNFREYLARGGTTYRKKAADLLRALGVAPADIPEAPERPRSEELFGSSMDGDPRAEAKQAEGATPVEEKAAEAKPEQPKPDETGY